MKETGHPSELAAKHPGRPWMVVDEGRRALLHRVAAAVFAALAATLLMKMFLSSEPGGQNRLRILSTEPTGNLNDRARLLCKA
jgi:hypothetical protein